MAVFLAYCFTGALDWLLQPFRSAISGQRTWHVQIDRPSFATDELHSKALGDWSSEDVHQWLISNRFSVGLADALRDEAITGDDLVSFAHWHAGGTLGNSGHARDVIGGDLVAMLKNVTKTEQSRFQKAIHRLVNWKGSPPPGFWGYRRHNRWHADMFVTGLTKPHLARPMLLYLQWFERNSTLAFLDSHSAQLPVLKWRPPVEGVGSSGLCGSMPHTF